MFHLALKVTIVSVTFLLGLAHSRAESVTFFPMEMSSEQARELLDAKLIHRGPLQDSPPLECSEAGEQRPNVLLKDRSEQELFQPLKSTIASSKLNRMLKVAKDIRRQVPKITECGLHDAELVAILMYTEQLYKVINPAVRERDWRAIGKFGGTVRLIESGLERFKPFRGLVRRGLIMPEPVREQMQSSTMVVLGGLTSTSAGAAWPGTDRMLILSKTCRYIAPYSFVPMEHEVLCFSDMPVKVRYFDKAGDEHRFLLEEVDASEGMVVDPVW